MANVKPKLVDKARNGLQIREHADGTYQIVAAPWRANRAPIWTSRDLDRARDFVTKRNVSRAMRHVYGRGTY